MRFCEWCALKFKESWNSNRPCPFSLIPSRRNTFPQMCFGTMRICDLEQAK